MNKTEDFLVSVVRGRKELLNKPPSSKYLFNNEVEKVGNFNVEALKKCKRFFKSSSENDYKVTFITTGFWD